jgi:hypothetical protein
MARFFALLLAVALTTSTLAIDEPAALGELLSA